MSLGGVFGTKAGNAITNLGEPGGLPTPKATANPGQPGGLPAGNVTANPSGPGGLPAAIDLVTLAPAYGNSTYALPNRLQLTSVQLTQLNANAPTSTGGKAWFAAQHAVIASPATVTVVVEGNRSGAVRIMGIQPVASCHPPLAGTLFYSPSQGIDTNIQLLVILDAANPEARSLDGSDFFTAHTVSLTHGEQETFVIAVEARRAYCSFTFDMTVLDGSKTVTETISNAGQPFAITALDQQSSGPVYGAYQAMYIGGMASAARGSGLNWAQVDPGTYPTR
jgi:hypothetical protein